MNNIIKQPRWKKVEYSRNQITKAGRIIRNNNATHEEIERAIQIIDNWRAAHAYPLHIIYIHLRRFSKKYQNLIVAERLKRLDSIINKLNRETSMNLWTMHDLGGCRMIVRTIEDVYNCRNDYEHSRKRHINIREYDYIQNPKESGYRSLHVVYEYFSDKKQDYNNNMLIEIQFRTHLQHLWATAVETMGLFTNQAIKSGMGAPDITRFFVLVSSLFAKEENMPVVPNTPDSISELIREIKLIDSKNNFLNILSSIKVAIQLQKNGSFIPNGYCVMTLNYDENQLTFNFFKSSDIEQANSYYSEIEKSNVDKQKDSVLVRVSSFAELRSAYPNYFSDISEFVDKVKKYIN